MSQKHLFHPRLEKEAQRVPKKFSLSKRTLLRFEPEACSISEKANLALLHLALKKLLRFQSRFF